METKCLWLIFRVHRTQIIPSLDPKMQQFVIRMVSKHHACTSLGLKKKVEPALTALRRLHSSRVAEEVSFIRKHKNEC